MTTVVPGDDFVHGLLHCPASSKAQVLFAAKDSGLHRSGDGGVTWVNTFAVMSGGAAVPALAIAHSAVSGTSRIAGPATVFAGIPGGVVRSNDNGDTWSGAQLASPAPIVAALAISPDFGNDGVVLAGTLDDGVFRSVDRGVKWFAWNFGLVDTRVRCLLASPTLTTDETVYAGTETGLFTSANGGRSWTEVQTPVGHVAVNALSEHHSGSTSTLYAATAHGLLVSADEGATWEQRGISSLPASIDAVIADPSGATVSAIAGGVLHVSADEGVTWELADRHAPQAATTAASYPLRAGDPMVTGHINGRVSTDSVGKAT